MRLRLLTFAGAVALALAVPSAALAHHGRGHHRHHHASKAHHAKFHFEHIGPSGVSGQTTTPSAPTTPTPTTPTTPNENAGKVTSYEKEVLTITLNDNTTTATGKVTADTRIVCVPATTTPTTEPGDKSPGDDSGEGDDQSRGDMSQSGGGWGDDQGDQEDQGDDDGGPATAPEPPCDTSLLVSGTLVRAGELRIGPSGAEWEFLVLVR
jgi:hypothetical protein